MTYQIIYCECVLVCAVSYTHLDVYKRQAMTNITGQVRQSQEEMEVIRNRPTSFTNFPIKEHREWSNFRQYKRKPMEFLARIEEYMDKYRGNRWVQNRELLDELFGK